MTGPTAEWRPRLAPGLLLRHDTARACDVLLMPERVVVLHGGAHAVLELCDGTRTPDAIAAELAGRYSGAAVPTEAKNFLMRIREEGWVR
ncbi:pyrroloquinoline quinone biosynthesis peptide chaperone PqqD [Streptomyces sp. NPDC101455]|uniref:pyrroloquinoline quinone biosynthesis peptide chaperone PqqD n=1 Tax=Streptomyces sp. NPDC101455 TaxID=3366142 RepID=UPI00382235F8